jgi:glc operon protein GlcG
MNGTEKDTGTTAGAPLVASRLRLTHEGATRLLQAAVAKATEMGQPQCIAIVDEGANLLAFVRMDGAKVLSIRSATRKAMTAASGKVPTGDTQADLATRLALATGGLVTNLKGGLPIVVGGEVVGGIGVGSGTGDQDREVANHALRALPGAGVFD